MARCPIDGTEFTSEYVQLADTRICTQCAAQVGMIYGSSLTEAESEKHSLAEVKTLMSTNSKVTTQDEIDFQKKEVKHRRVPTQNQKSQQPRSSKSAIWGTVSLVVIILVGGIIVKTSSGHDTKQAVSSSTSSLTPSEKLASIKDNEQLASYNPVGKAFDLSTLSGRSNSWLSNQGGKGIIVSNAKVIGLGADKQKKYHILAKIPNSSVMTLTVVGGKKSGKVVKGGKITVYGHFVGKTTIDSAQVKAGISEDYAGTSALNLAADEVVSYQ